MEMANDRPLVGVGHQAFQAAYSKYDTLGEFGEKRAAHSSWFGVLADLGFPGLILFILLVANGFRTCIRAQRLAKRDPSLESLGKMAMAIEGALLVYCVGGSFVSDQYLEMHWHMLALSVVVDRLVRERATVTERVPVGRRLEGVAAALAGRIAIPAVRPAKS
jgi:O-antigen ligase